MRKGLQLLITLILGTSAFYTVGAQTLPVGTILPYSGELNATTEKALHDAGWVPCDGRPLRRSDPATGQNTEYAPLFAVIHETYGAGFEEGVVANAVPPPAKKGDFNVPDCRGRFLRGVDDGSGRDPDRASRAPSRLGGNAGDRIGSVQADELRHHNHGATGASQRSIFASVPMGQAEAKTGMDGGGMFIDNGASGVSRGQESVAVTVNDNGGNETRPKNISVNWIVRYK